MVEDTMVAVTALKSAVVSAVGILVKLYTKVYYMLDVLSSLTDEGMNSLDIILEASCDKCIVLVILDIIRGRVVNTCDTALGK